jgi:hypothetical protein
MIQYVFVDSRNASSGSSNSYVLHLTHRIKNIERVDLVSAKVPNTMYNITNGSITLSGNTISVPSGFYSAYGLETVLPIQYIPDQDIFSFNNPGTINSASPDVQKCLGLTSLPLTTPTTSQTLIDLSTNDFVFLDIDELTTTATIDSKTITSGDTYKGSTIAGTFGMIPMDVASGQIKTFKEHTDYSYSILYKNLPSIDRLTVRWLDLNGNLLNFNGFNNNSFILHAIDLRLMDITKSNGMQAFYSGGTVTFQGISTNSRIVFRSLGSNVQFTFLKLDIQPEPGFTILYIVLFIINYSLWIIPIIFIIYFLLKKNYKKIKKRTIK